MIEVKDRIEWDCVFQVLEPLLDIPDNASDMRCHATLEALGYLGRLEQANPCMSGCIERFRCSSISRFPMDALTLACRSRRPASVRFLLKYTPSLCRTSLNGLSPLLFTCQLPRMCTPVEFSVTYPSGNRNVHVFKDWGYTWALRVTKPGEFATPTTFSCDCCSKNNRDLKEDASDTAKEMKGTPYLTVHLELKDRDTLRGGRVKVTLCVEVAGLSGQQLLNIYYCVGETGVDCSPAAFKLVDPVTGENAVEANKTVSVKFSITEVTFRGRGHRALRSASDIQVHQEEIITQLVDEGSDLHMVNACGQTALSMALEGGLSDFTCSLLLPKDITAAINSLFNSRKDIMQKELDLLLKNFPPAADCSKIAISGLVRKMDSNSKRAYSKGAMTIPALVKTLERFLGIGGVPISEFNKCIKIAVEQRDWNTLGVLLKFRPAEGFDTSGLSVHDAVASDKVDLVRELLKAGANANEVSPCRIPHLKCMSLSAEQQTPTPAKDHDGGRGGDSTARGVSVRQRRCH